MTRVNLKNLLPLCHDQTDDGIIAILDFICNMVVVEAVLLGHGG